MALRDQATVVILMLVACEHGLAADFAVRHIHIRKDRPGVLTVDADGVRYEEVQRSKHPHTFHWTWDDLQEITLSATRIQIKTYRDQKWLGGKDEVQTFAGKSLDSAYPVLREHLPRRLVPELAWTGTEPGKALPARRLESRNGYNGTLLVGNDRLVFRSATTDGSHTWIFEEIENISSSDPLQLTIASLGREYRLQLKQPFPETLYNDLWRKFNVRETH